MRYGLYDTKPYTQREIAKELGVYEKVKQEKEEFVDNTIPFEYKISKNKYSKIFLCSKILA